MQKICPKLNVLWKLHKTPFEESPLSLDVIVNSLTVKTLLSEDSYLVYSEMPFEEVAVLACKLEFPKINKA